MDTDITPEDECEHLMNIVVESRKRFGKMCIDYEQKKNLMENKMLDLTLGTISNYRIKPKNDIPDLDVEQARKDSKIFAAEISQRLSNIKNFEDKLNSTLNIIHQLKHDIVNKKLNEPVAAETLLSRAKQRT